MAQREIVFVLSKETDAEFQEALKRLREDFSDWRVCGLARREETKNNQRIPVAVITIEL